MAERDKKTPPESPMETAGWFSVTTLSFLNSIVALGAKRPLEVDDMHQLPKWLMSTNIHAHFQPFWEEEQRSNTTPRFSHALWRDYWRRWGLASICECFYAMMLIFQPLFMEAMLKYVSGDKDAQFLGITTGIGLAFSLSLVTLLGSVIFNLNFYHM